MSAPDVCVGLMRQPLAMKPQVGGGLSFGRIAKPLRGGGGGAATSTSPTFGGSSAASPLGRLQSEESRYVFSDVNRAQIFFIN